MVRVLRQYFDGAQHKFGTKINGFSLLILCLMIPPQTSIAIPTSERSKEAIARVKPQLMRDLEEKGLHYGSAIFLRIFKEPKKLELWVQQGKQFQLFRIYDICTYSGELGPKQKQGDLQSPEGFYFVTPRQMNPLSRFHLSFNLGYPNEYDRAYDRTGNALMVHGNCVSIGCYAMTDEKIEEIYALADAAFRAGQPFFRVHIFPFYMTTDNMQRFKDSIWFNFWVNLKMGYDLFEQVKYPSNVVVRDKQYIFIKP